MVRPDRLLSEASSLSAREIITALGLLGHVVDACSPTRWCLGGFSKWVQRVRLTPAVDADPMADAQAVAGLCEVLSQ